MNKTDLPILVVPNAGMPLNDGGKAVYRMTPQKWQKRCRDLSRIINSVRIIGGCCGTNPNHILELRKMIDSEIVIST